MCYNDFSKLKTLVHLNLGVIVGYLIKYPKVILIYQMTEGQVEQIYYLPFADCSVHVSKSQQFIQFYD